MTPSEAFPKRCRIRWRGEFLRIQGQAQRIHGKRLILQFAPRPRTSNSPRAARAAKGGASEASGGIVITSRIGLTVSKKVGGAVLRNRVKRWLREAFRRAPPELRPRLDPTLPEAPRTSPYDLVVTVKRGIDDFSYAVLRDELLNGIARHLQSRPPARAAHSRGR